MKHLYLLSSASNGLTGADDYWLEHSESCPCLAGVRVPVHFYSGVFVWIETHGRTPLDRTRRVSTTDVPLVITGRNDPYRPMVDALLKERYPE